MALTELEKLRQLLGESVPPDGTDADTMFSNEAVQSFLDDGGGDVEAAAYFGWRAKWAEYSNLANTSSGTTRDELGSLETKAKTQMDYYGNLSGLVVTSSPSTRTRIGRIER